MAYGGVHIVTGNFTLFGAAGIAGAHWCALYAAGVPLGALVVSHVTWDVWIFLVQPTGEVAPGRTALGGLRRLTYGARRPVPSTAPPRLAVVRATTSGLVTRPSKSSVDERLDVIHQAYAVAGIHHVGVRKREHQLPILRGRVRLVPVPAVDVDVGEARIRSVSA